MRQMESSHAHKMDRVHVHLADKNELRRVEQIRQETLRSKVLNRTSVLLPWTQSKENPYLRFSFVLKQAQQSLCASFGRHSCVSVSSSERNAPVLIQVACK